MINPYKPPSAENETPLILRAIQWIRAFTWLYPVLLVGMFYITWLVAWTTLGHRPRPNLDDPKSIGHTVDGFYWLAMLLLMGFPAALLAGVLMQLSNTRLSWIRRFAASVVLVALWFCAIAILRWDPMRVGEWYMD